MRNSTQCSDRSLASWLQPTLSQYVVKNKTSKHRLLHYSPKAGPFHRNASEQCSGQTQRCASLINTNCQRQRSNNKKCVRNVSVINSESSTAQRATEPENSTNVHWGYFCSSSPAAQTEMTTELELAAASCCLLQQTDLDHAFLFWKRGTTVRHNIFLKIKSLYCQECEMKTWENLLTEKFKTFWVHC